MQLDTVHVHTAADLDEPIFSHWGVHQTPLFAHNHGGDCFPSQLY